MARVLVAYGSKMGGTAGIADRIGAVLGAAGHDAVVTEASRVKSLYGYDAAVVGSGLYAGMWRRPARRLVRRIARREADLPLWLFHSGPLGDEEAGSPQKFPKWLLEAEAGLDVRDKATFGGVIGDDARGFLAKSMRKNGMGGDWRDMEQVAGWAETIAAALN